MHIVAASRTACFIYALTSFVTHFRSNVPSLSLLEKNSLNLSLFIDVWQL